ncbi:hypothetical protein AURDEDRAFT_130896 [Auricularia subglabra TFB-10046 SS5]|nr:hypothetical protein AURDEDRAFT_130896 [Auricularia subglabra TFB-10046 SS5]
MWRQLVDGSPMNACKALEDAICDERRPAESFCTICFLAVPGMVLEMDGPAIVQQRAQCCGIFAALRQRLQHGIDHCSGRRPGQPHEPISMFYDTHVSDPPDPLELFRILLCACLLHCLCSGDSTTGNNREAFMRPDRPNKRFRASTGTWPVKLVQLFPFGPEHTVDGLLEACCGFMDISAFWVLAAVLNLSRPRIWTIMLRPDNHRRLAWRIMTITLLGLPSSPVHLEMLARLAPPGYTVPSNAMNSGWFLETEVRGVAVLLLNTVKDGPYHRPDDVLELVGIDLPLFERALRIAADHYRSTDPAASKCFQEYHAILGVHVDASAAVSSSALPRHIRQNPRGHGVLVVLRVAISALRAHRYCAGPQCGRSMLDLEGEGEKSLSECSRCRLARYCSQECQGSDWRAGTPAAHKKLCPLFVRVRGILDASATLPEYARRVQQSAIADTDLVMLATWALSRGQRMRDLLAFSMAICRGNWRKPEIPGKGKFGEQVRND